MIIAIKINNYSNSSGDYRGQHAQFDCDENAKLSKGDLAIHTTFGLCYIYEDVTGVLCYKSPHVSGGCLTSRVNRCTDKLKKVVATSEDYFNLPLIKPKES